MNKAAEWLSDLGEKIGDLLDVLVPFVCLAAFLILVPLIVVCIIALIQGPKP